ncbi:MAG: glycosyltransferase family 4 protein [Thiobacillus sp.]|nr:glycosyltransferase family 4 protein [Thiobacillus sp.]
MNLLMFNLAVDDKHVTLAFGLRWIEALAARYEHIDVVTMTAGHHQLPDNVTVWSVGRERGYPEWLRALRFYWLVWRILRQRRIDVVFTHMIPVFAVLFWPVGLLTGLKNVLWYAHGATPRMLKLAHRLVDRVVSSTPQGFRLSSDKVSFIGQGIDAARYQALSRITDTGFHLLTVGRLAPSKGLDLLVSALADWRPDTDWHLTIVGDGTSESEHHYAHTLRHQAQDTLGSNRVTFTGRLDTDAIVPLLGKSDVFINLSSTGSLDKAMVEAMASGCPVVSSNDAFRAIAVTEGFPECAIEHSPQSLRAVLDRLASMSASERQALGGRQAEIARRDHTLDGLIQRLYDILAANARGRK